MHLMHRHMKVAEICFSVSIPRWLFGCVCRSEVGNKKAEKRVAAMGVECIFPLSLYKKTACIILEKFESFKFNFVILSHYYKTFAK